MGIPNSRNVGAYMLAARTNALGHAAKGSCGRTVTNTLIAISAVLSAVVGAGVFADAFSKTVVGWTSLAASIASVLAIACLTTLKFDAHLRLQGQYESVCARLVQCQTDTGYDPKFEECIEHFNRAVDTAGHEKASLTGRQVDQFEKKARKKILASTTTAQDLKDNMPARVDRASTTKGEALPRLPAQA